MKRYGLFSFVLALIFGIVSSVPTFAAGNASDYPEKFNLRDENLVSSVKFQNHPLFIQPEQVRLRRK